MAKVEDSARKGDEKSKTSVGGRSLVPCFVGMGYPQIHHLGCSKTLHLPAHRERISMVLETSQGFLALV